jgi:hypothetical protein
MEEWREIKDYPNYLVSNLGNIKYLVCRYSKQRINGFGLGKKNEYQRVWLRKSGTKKRVPVHRLVLEAFVGPSKLFVNHKNGIRSDNRLENLEYVTSRENTLHALRTGLSPVGSAHGNSKLKIEQVREIRASRKSLNQLSKEYGVAQSLIGRLKRGIAWRYLK